MRKIKRKYSVFQTNIPCEECGEMLWTNKEHYWCFYPNCKLYRVHIPYEENNNRLKRTSPQS